MTDTSTHDIASLGGQTMGTTWSVKLVAPRRRDLHPLHSVIQQQLDQVVAQMSTWQADSDISRYNRAAAGSWQQLPEAFAEVIEAGLQIAAASDGAFDPTVGPMVGLWGFGAHAGTRTIPSIESITATRLRCGWQRLQWRVHDHALLQPGNLELDLSAIAKGYAVDLVQRQLQHQGIANALIEVGGELLGYGHKPDGSSWRVLIESAPEEDSATHLPMRVLALDGLAVATSGDRWHRFDADGQRYTHTLDPRLGQPVERAAAAVTVIAASAMHADAWATAMTVLGPEQGLRMASANHLAVRFLARTIHGLEEHLSPAFQQHLENA